MAVKTAFAVVCILTMCPLSFAARVTCDRIAEEAAIEAAALVPAAGQEVVGKGRLYFHTAPDEKCREKSIFVIPGDRLIAYSEFRGWLSVMYMNPKTGKDYHGWVPSERLKFTGTMGPGE